jgi:hypothetical protein
MCKPEFYPFYIQKIIRHCALLLCLHEEKIWAGIKVSVSKGSILSINSDKHIGGLNVIYKRRGFGSL